MIALNVAALLIHNRSKRTRVNYFQCSGFYVFVTVSYAIYILESLYLLFWNFETFQVHFLFSAFACGCWCVAFYFLTSNSPESHPRISTCEKEYLLHSKNVTIKAYGGKAKRFPGLSIFKSMPLLAAGISFFGFFWECYLISITLPLFIKECFGYDVWTVSMYYILFL